MVGGYKYLPLVLLDELDDIKREHDIIKDRDAMQKMVEYTKVGREVERIMNGMTLNFSWRKRK